MRKPAGVGEGGLLPYQLPVREIARQFRTDLTSGLTREEAARRLQEYGRNVIERRRQGLSRMLARRLTSALTLVLLAAIGISLFLGEVGDAVLIGVVLLLDVIVGLLYESYTQYRIGLIQEQVPRIAEVFRDRHPRLIPADDLVPGDLVILREGERGPADIRLTKVTGLQVNESVLTGEPGDVQKTTGPIDAPAVTADQRNMVFAGTTVAIGEAEGVVVATGPQSVLGALARRVVEAGWQVTPLEARLRRVGQLLGAGILAAASLLFVLGVVRGEAPAEMFRAVLTLAVAAIPEDLTFILTVALAIGAVRLLSRRAITRHLTAAETLGDATVIATDKTGTLTTGELVLRQVEGIAERWNRAVFPSAASHPLFRRAMAGAAVGALGRSGTQPLRGSAIERAIRDGVATTGMDLSALHRAFPLFSSLTFHPRHRYRASLHDDPTTPDPVLFVVGAPEALLPKSVAASHGEKSTALTEGARAEVLERAAEAAAAGTRVLAVCLRHLARSHRTVTHADVDRLTFLALLHFDDPLRPDALEAVRSLQRAGVQILLLTGDHRGTAEAVGRSSGILRSPGTFVLDGVAVDRLSDRGLAETLRNTAVVARVDPLQKERVVSVLQHRGEVVAMIGDGVNDAVALRRADLGVAVATAADVAKDASDLVLLDGSLSTLTAAVWEGRRIRETVRTVLAYLFSTNLTEILAVATALLLALPLPFLPAQLLWVNVVTDGTADIALALEPASTRPGDRAPGRRQGLFRVTDLIGMLLTSLALLVPTMVAYLWALEDGGGVAYARTVAFVTLASGQIFAAFSYRSLTKPLIRLAPASNIWLLFSVALSFGLLVAAVHWTPLSALLGTVPLAPRTWAAIQGLALAGFVGVEFRKFLLPRIVGQRARQTLMQVPGWEVGR